MTEREQGTPGAEPEETMLEGDDLEDVDETAPDGGEQGEPEDELEPEDETEAELDEEEAAAGAPGAAGGERVSSRRARAAAAAAAGGGGRFRGIARRPTEPVAPATPSETAVHIDDRISQVFVGVVIGVFALILLYGLLFGAGGFFTPLATPAPPPTAAPSAGASAAPSPGATLAPSPAASPAASASPSAS